MVAPPDDGLPGARWMSASRSAVSALKPGGVSGARPVEGHGHVDVDGVVHGERGAVVLHGDADRVGGSRGGGGGPGNVILAGDLVEEIALPGDRDRHLVV